MERQTIIFWVFIGIFSITAVVTLLGITNVIKVRYLKVFVTGLILEVVGIVIAWGNPVDYSTEIDRLWSVVYQDSTLAKPENEIEKLTLIRGEIDQIRKGNSIPNDSLTGMLGIIKNQLDASSDTIQQLRSAIAKLQEGQSASGYTGFIENVLKLRGIMLAHDWENINLGWLPAEKDNAGVYDLLEKILNPLQIPVNFSSAKDLSEKSVICQQALATFILRPGVTRDSTSAISPRGEKNPARVKEVWLGKWLLDKFIIFFLQNQLQ